ncbi:hypothetical protein [Thermococcus sp.]|uniref:hypothetical protein n=1 Tax=Thermococcus sp. TaxID=35749 RepID=UPI002629EC21|nr:hypothetical protein [Thermococcus sp.]
MDLLGDFFEDDVSEVLRRVSSLPPRDVLSYLVSTSQRVLAVYQVMTDSLPRGYGKIKFSRFVEKKERQTEELWKIALRLHPESLSSEVKGEDIEVSIETVGDYAEVLEQTIKLEELQLRACRYLSGKIGDPDLSMLLQDLANEIEENISFLREELERVKGIERKVKFSEFVRELVGDRDGRV